MGSRSPWAIFGGKGRPIVKYRDTLRSSVQSGWTDGEAVWVVHTDVPKEARVRWGVHRCQGTLPWKPLLFFYICGVRWRHLANTIEPSVCGGDATLCHITLTTCFFYFLRKQVIRHPPSVSFNILQTFPHDVVLTPTEKLLCQFPESVP